jgi:hypothetical protein
MSKEATSQYIMAIGHYIGEEESPSRHQTFSRQQHAGED